MQVGIILLVVENIVDTIFRKSIAVVSIARAFTTFAEGIFKAVTNFVIAVRGGRVIEIAADDDGIVAAVDMFVNSNALLLPSDEGRFYFLEDFFCFLVEIGIVELAVKNLFTSRIIYIVHVYGCEVQIIDAYRVIFVLYIHKDGAVG